MQFHTAPRTPLLSMLFPVLPGEYNTEHTGMAPYIDGFEVHKPKTVTQQLQFQLINKKL